MMPVKKYTSSSPSLDEVAKLLQIHMKETFEVVSADVVTCPNLKDEPFRLAAEGLCGKTAVADVGGVPYLIPLVQKDKLYNLKDVAKEAGISDAFVIGAGAGPFHHVGTNCEMMANVNFGEGGTIGTYIAKLRSDGSPHLEKLTESTEFGVLGNFFVSEGKVGQVIRVHAKRRRTGSDNFITAMRKILAEHYGNTPVAVGGVFLLNSGKAKLHIMPNFSEVPLTTDDDVNNWLKFFNMSAPLVCLTSFVSSDPGLDLRMEHTHCFSDHGEGGHYHADTTPDSAEYLGYFNVAESIVRIDPPTTTHNVGRD